MGIIDKIRSFITLYFGQKTLELPENTFEPNGKNKLKLDYIKVLPQDFVNAKNHHNNEKPKWIKLCFEISNELLGTVPQEIINEMNRRSGVCPIYGGETVGSKPFIVQEYGDGKFVILRGEGEETIETLKNKDWKKYQLNSKYDNNTPLHSTQIIIQPNGKIYLISVDIKTHSSEKYWDKDKVTQNIHPDFEQYRLELMYNDYSCVNECGYYPTILSDNIYDFGKIKPKVNVGFFVRQTIQKADRIIYIDEYYNNKSLSDPIQETNKNENLRDPLKIAIMDSYNERKTFEYNEDAKVYEGSDGKQYTIWEIREIEQSYGFNYSFYDKALNQFVGKDKKAYPPIPPVISEIVKKYNNQIKNRSSEQELEG